jgi:ribonuclease E
MKPLVDGVKPPKMPKKRKDGIVKWLKTITGIEVEESKPKTKPNKKFKRKNYKNKPSSNKKFNKKAIKPTNKNNPKTNILRLVKVKIIK